MNPEKEIVNLWLNKQGFFTVSEINANSRVIDIIAIKQGKEKNTIVKHVELHCSVSSPSTIVSEKEKSDLIRKFNDGKVVTAVERTIKNYLGEVENYEKVLITTKKVSLSGITVVSFHEVLSDVVAELDRQNYSNPIVRSLQLAKFVMMSNPSNVASLVAGGEEVKIQALTSQRKEQLLKKLLKQDFARRVFGRKENEDLAIEVLKNSPLKNPERLAAAIEKSLTKRTATMFINLLLKQKKLKTAIKEEISKDQKLFGFFKS
jgi:hypothetical protein